jgi:hypothetical protein
MYSDVLTATVMRGVYIKYEKKLAHYKEYIVRPLRKNYIYLFIYYSYTY